MRTATKIGQASSLWIRRFRSLLQCSILGSRMFRCQCSSLRLSADPTGPSTCALIASALLQATQGHRFRNLRCISMRIALAYRSDRISIKIADSLTTLNLRRSLVTVSFPKNARSGRVSRGNPRSPIRMAGVGSHGSFDAYGRLPHLRLLPLLHHIHHPFHLLPLLHHIHHPFHRRCLEEATGPLAIRAPVAVQTLPKAVLCRARLRTLVDLWICFGA